MNACITRQQQQRQQFMIEHQNDDGHGDDDDEAALPFFSLSLINSPLPVWIALHIQFEATAVSKYKWL